MTDNESVGSCPCPMAARGLYYQMVVSQMGLRAMPDKAGKDVCEKVLRSF